MLSEMPNRKINDTKPIHPDFPALLQYDSRTFRCGTGLFLWIRTCKIKHSHAADEMMGLAVDDARTTATADLQTAGQLRRMAWHAAARTAARKVADIIATQAPGAVEFLRSLRPTRTPLHIATP